MLAQSCARHQESQLASLKRFKVFSFFQVGQAIMSDRVEKDNRVFKSVYTYYRKHRVGSAVLLFFSLFFAAFFHKGLATGTLYTIGDQFAELHALRLAACAM